MGNILFVLVLLVLAVVFGMQNTAAVTINFLFWSFQGSVALVLVVSMLAGIVVGILVSLPYYNRRGRIIKALRDELKLLKSEMESIRQSMTSNQAPPAPNGENGKPKDMT